MLYGLVDKYDVTDIPIDVWIDMSRECFPYMEILKKAHTLLSCEMNLGKSYWHQNALCFIILQKGETQHVRREKS